MNVFSKIVLFTLFLFFGNAIFAQHTTQRTIRWNAPTELHPHSFERSVFPETENSLPYFSEIFKAEDFSTTNIRLQVLDAVFEQVPYDMPENQSAKIRKELEITQILGKERGKYRVNLMFLPFRKVGSTVERVVSFKIKVLPQALSAQKKNELYIPTQSVLSSGNWIKIKVPTSGIYKLSYNKLQDMGISNPSNVRIYGFGGQLSFLNKDEREWHLKENQIYKGENYILFFAEGANTWSWDNDHNMFLHKQNDYDDYAYFFLTDNAGSGDNSIKPATGNLAANQSSDSYDALFFHEEEERSFLKSGRDWYGEDFEVTENQSFRFDTPELVSNSACRAQVVFAARSNPSSSFAVSNSAFSQSKEILEIPMRYEGYYARTDTLTANFNWSGGSSIPIDIAFNKASPDARGWLDYISLNTRAKLKYANQSFVFRDINSLGEGKVTTFNIASEKELQVWDVTDPQQPTQIPTQFSAGTVSFSTKTDVLKTFVAFSVDENFPEPEFVKNVSNQNLHGLPTAQLLIVTHENFLEQAEELAKLHREKDGLSVHVITQQQIFNEFSSGRPDASAIRDFVRMFYIRANGNASLMPKYLLLFGDGSYVNRYADPAKMSFIMTYQSKNSLYNTKSFVSDDFFGLLDEDEGEHEGFLDIGIGRLPVQSVSEAQTLVNKIKQYYDPSSFGSWRNRVMFVADDTEDGDGYYFMRQSEDMSAQVWEEVPGILPEKIYLDAYEQQSSSVGPIYPDVNEAIDAAVETGCLLINYVGHGSEYLWADEHVLTVNQVENWNNLKNLTTLMTATCEFSRFDDYRISSAGEKTLLNPQGGAVALFTTTRLVYAYPNELLNKAFFDYALNQINEEDNSTNRMGDILRKSKVAVGAGINKRNFTLLGDPAVALAIGQNNAYATHFDLNTITTENDTIRALQKVNVQGKVTIQNGELLSGFSGIIRPTVYDRPVTVYTKGNDGLAPYPITRYDNFVYKGKASVNNGIFNFSFVVPKDIRYEYGKGKIGFYGNDATTDLKGAYDQLVIGGSASNAISDTEGPEIELFFNDDKFVSGGTTNENPTLIAKLTDQSGINTLGTGIGHDIEAHVDENEDKKHTLNNYFETDLDQYQSGKVKFKLPDQTSGEHTLTFKAWDVLNNSSVSEIDFVVVSSEKLRIEKLFNYPNPFTERTSFFFKHNRPYEELDVLIQIFAPSGRIVKTLETTISGDALLSPAIEWDGYDDFGDAIGRGVYFYQLKVRTQQGEIVDKYEKLLILK